jgi:peptide/nickel transport system substrate-binding protein
MRRSSIIASGAALAVAFGAGFVGAAGGATGRADARSAVTSAPLVIDTTFDLATADPDHMFDSTGQIIDHSVYSTLLTYRNNNLKLQPQLARRYTVSKNGDKYTFYLNPKAAFADDAPVTSADVLFSFKRLKNLKSKPAFLLSGIKVSAPTPSTVVLSTTAPDAAIPEIVTNPSLGVLEAGLVQSYGGTDAPNAAKTDTAEEWLNDNSAGSGPYEIQSWNVNGPVTLVANPNYWGTKPKYQTVIIQNARPEQQKRDIERGAAQLALDLSPDQAKGITNARVKHATSTSVLYTSLNTNSKISATTSNPKIVQAVKDAISYSSLASLAGSGAEVAPSLIPAGFSGSLPLSDALKQNIATAKKLVRQSGVHKPSITISFAHDDPVNGIQLGSVAALIRADLGAVGIKVTLQSQPLATASSLQSAGKAQEIISYWSPGFPDANDYLPFVPGGQIADQVHWGAGSATNALLAKLANQAATASTEGKHNTLWQRVERDSNAAGPIIPLIQPAQILVTSKSITRADSNPGWQIDVASIR